MNFFGNFFEKNYIFWAIFWHSNGNFREGQLATQGSLHMTFESERLTFLFLELTFTICLIDRYVKRWHTVWGKSSLSPSLVVTCSTWYLPDGGHVWLIRSKLYKIVTKWDKSVFIWDNIKKKVMTTEWLVEY